VGQGNEKQDRKKNWALLRKIGLCEAQHMYQYYIWGMKPLEFPVGLDAGSENQSNFSRSAQNQSVGRMTSRV
jgi:uncharacterized protein (DUF2225 family)